MKNIRAIPRRLVLFSTCLYCVAPAGCAQWQPTSVSPHSLGSQADTATMTGYVVDARFGRPLEGVAVDIDGSRGEVLTNARGVFVIRGLEMGRRQLTASQHGYLTVTLDVEHQGTQLLVRLAPDPLILDGLAVTLDRLERRRRSLPYSVEVLDAGDLAASPTPDVRDFVIRRTGQSVMRCEDGFELCTVVRGTQRPVVLYIDDVLERGGLNQLAAFRPQDLHTVEIIRGCGTVRAYTRRFVEDLARGKVRLIPSLRC